jgi:hypothetical protein
VADLAAFDCILGLPWLEDHNPVISWKKEKLLVPTPDGAVEVDLGRKPCRSHVDSPSLLSTLQLEGMAKKGDPVYVVALKENDEENGQSTPGAPPLPAEWARLVKEYADVFSDDQPGLPPDRAVQLESNLKARAQPASKPAYRLSPAEMDELKTKLVVLLEKGLIRPSTSPWGPPPSSHPSRTEG